MDVKDIELESLDELLTLDLKWDEIRGYKIMIDEDTYMVFGKAFWAKASSEVIFDKVVEYINLLIREGQVSNLYEKVNKLFHEIGVQTCKESGLPAYTAEKMKRLEEFLSLDGEGLKDFQLGIAEVFK